MMFLVEAINQGAGCDDGRLWTVEGNEIGVAGHQCLGSAGTGQAHQIVVVGIRGDPGFSGWVVNQRGVDAQKLEVGVDLVDRQPSAELGPVQNLTKLAE